MKTGPDLRLLAQQYDAKQKSKIQKLAYSMLKNDWPGFKIILAKCEEEALKGEYNTTVIFEKDEDYIGLLDSETYGVNTKMEAVAAMASALSMLGYHTPRGNFFDQEAVTEDELPIRW